jgi:EF-P beta-lysylation protein EpmB
MNRVADTPRRPIASPAPPPPEAATADWPVAMKRAIRDAAELCRRLGLPPPSAGDRQAAEQFPVFVPLEYLRRMRHGDPHDPLLKQVLAHQLELQPVPGFGNDPLQEATAAPVPGLLHKYAGRVLLVTTGACAVHCRYCFRRHFPYDAAPKSLDDWEPALRYIQRDESVEEVLLSGGDPLTLSDAVLARLARRIAEVVHVRRLRLHTRLPIVVPQRVCDALLDWLAGTRLQPIVVLHANHPAELDEQVAAACHWLHRAGVLLFNQAVLLRGVNDAADVLAALCLRLVELRVVPYYLHQLDRVAGAAHFEVPAEEGRQIFERLRCKVPGYALPQYVCEVPGAGSKIPVP